MNVLWIVLGAAAGSASVVLLARGTRGLISSGTVPAFMLGAAARVVAVAALGLAAFLSDPAHGVGFVVGLAAGRLAAMRLVPDGWLG